MNENNKTSFPAGTLILTDKGMIEIENVTVGTKVLTYTGAWHEVTAVNQLDVSSTTVLKGFHYGLEYAGGGGTQRKNTLLAVVGA